MTPAYSIVTERPVDGFDLFGRGEAVALASDLLDRLAADAGVRPLLDFFSMDPGEVDTLYEGLGLGAEADRAAGEWEGGAWADPEVPDLDLEPAPAEEWFAAAEGLATVRALIGAVAARPVPEVPDPFDPPAGAILADLRSFELILDRLAAAGLRWHLAVDF